MKKRYSSQSICPVISAIATQASSETTVRLTLGSFMWRARHEPERWVRKPQLAEHFGCSERTLERWQKRGMPRKRLGRRLVLFRVSECEAWLEEQSGS